MSNESNTLTPIVRLIGKVALLTVLVLLVDRSMSAVLQHGLLAYFGIDRPLSMVCIGHSRTVLGIDSRLLEDSLQIPVAKYAIQGAGGRDRAAMINHAMARCGDTLEAIVLDVSAYSLNDRGLSANSAKLFTPFQDDPVMGKYVAETNAPRDLSLGRLMHLTRYNEAILGLSIRGLLGRQDNLKFGTLDKRRLQRRIETGRTLTASMSDEALEFFQASIRQATDAGIHVVLVYVPTVDILNNLDRPNHDAIIDAIRAVADSQPLVDFVDLNSEYEARHELFSDGLHLNAAGQKEVTQRLVTELVTLGFSSKKTATEADRDTAIPAL